MTMSVRVAVMSASAEAIESVHDSLGQDRSRSPSRSSESLQAVAQHVCTVVATGEMECRKVQHQIHGDGEE